MLLQHKGKCMDQQSKIQELFICDCHDVQHQMIVRGHHEWPELYINIHLSQNQNFLQRVYSSIKYIFGHRDSGFDEVVLNEQQQERLFTVLGHHISRNQKHFPGLDTSDV